MQGVWQNALTYNEPESDAHSCAMILKDMFEKDYLPIPNGTDDAPVLQKEKMMIKLSRQLLRPPTSIAVLNWELPRIGNTDRAGFEDFKWDSSHPIVISPAIKALLPLP
jgi:hypothetical protein